MENGLYAYKTIIIGKELIHKKPKKKYRIIIQQREINGDGRLDMRAFMIYDYKGMSTVDSIKKKLHIK